MLMLVMLSEYNIIHFLLEQEHNQMNIQRHNLSLLMTHTIINEGMYIIKLCLKEEQKESLNIKIQ